MFFAVCTQGTWDLQLTYLNEYRIPHNHFFFGFLQVRLYVRTNLRLQTDQPIDSPVDSFLLNFNLTPMDSRKLISLFYAKLYSLNPVTAGRYMEAWGRDLEDDLVANAWSDAFESVKKIFTCNRLRESQYRILHRLQRTPNLLNKINPQISPLCGKCKKEVGTYYHCIWHCPLIARYWKNIAKELSSIFDKTNTNTNLTSIYIYDGHL